MQTVKCEDISEFRISIKEISLSWNSWKLFQLIKDSKFQCFCTDAGLVKLLYFVPDHFFLTIIRRTKWRVVNMVMERKKIHTFLFFSQNNQEVLLICNSGSSKSNTNAWLILCSFTVDVRHDNKNWGVRTIASRALQIFLFARSKLKGFTKWLFSHTYSCFSVR